MATGAATVAADADTFHSDNATDDHQFSIFLPVLFIYLAFMGALILLLLIWFNQDFDLTMTQGVELVNGRGRLDTSRSRQEISGNSSQMTVVSRSNHPSVVHAISSNGARDEAAVVAGVSESTRAGGTTTVDERPVVVVPAGLNEWVIDTLCISEYKAGEGLHDGSSGETSECMICLGEIMEGQIVRFLPECSHVFHVQCIDAWLTEHVSCPLCRRAVMSNSAV